MAFQHVDGNSLSYGENTCDRQGNEGVTKQSLDFRCNYERFFLSQFVLDYWKIMIKVLPCRFQQCLGPVKTLTLEGCSKAGAFGHSSNHISRGQ